MSGSSASISAGKFVGDVIVHLAIFRLRQLGGVDAELAPWQERLLG
jgi:hypothetical protein